ncbi:MAG: YqhA family protein [Epsilonproteobacteria bacterium]|nr:YqhA family protein [Campylobacterota bacterium]
MSSHHEEQDNTKVFKSKENQSAIERIFESGIWNSRFIVILAVVFGLVGAIILFAVASYDIASVAGYAYHGLFAHPHPENFHENIVASIIGAVDLYLIAVVMFIFAFGLYELFISHIDEAQGHGQILAISSLDQLKDKIAKVIVMVLVVNFFQRVLHTNFSTPLEMLYFAGSITALAVGLYFLSKVGH